MNTAEKVEYWLDIADYDLDTAKAMYSTGRWLYVAFMCHQVIEKTLKAFCAPRRRTSRHISTTTSALPMVADYIPG